MLYKKFILASQQVAIKLKFHFSQIHQIEDGKYFIYEKVLDFRPPDESAYYVPVSFPQSQLFMEEYQDKIYLINDGYGLKRYGCAAYFVEEELYRKVISDFENEQTLALKIG